MEKKKKLKCRKCGHEWNPRTKGKDPDECPACKSRSWRKVKHR